MAEFYVRLDVYLQAASLDAAIEKAMDAVSGVSKEVYVADTSREVTQAECDCLCHDVEPSGFRHGSHDPSKCSCIGTEYEGAA